MVSVIVESVGICLHGAVVVMGEGGTVGRPQLDHTGCSWMRVVSRVRRVWMLVTSSGR